MGEVISLLSTEFRKKVGKLKDERMKNEAVAGVSYPTGFLSFDFLNGTVIHTKSETMPKYNSIGVLDGSVNIVIGRSGCGKSTLLNTLTDAGILAEDQLFATLDPTTRTLELPGGESVLMTDTVGFIRKLPHHLIEAFKSTLEEAKYADIILHVVDCFRQVKEDMGM